MAICENVRHKHFKYNSYQSKQFNFNTMKIIKKVITLLTSFLIIQLTTLSLFGQEDNNNDSRFGLGVSLFNVTDYLYEHTDNPTNLIYFTFNIGSKFRLEPILGFAFNSFEEYSLSLGGFFRKSISKFNILYGLRLGLNNGVTKVIAPSIGGEYYFIKNFSVGSEIQIRGLIQENDWTILTYSSVIVRFYL
jgi:hypothetical protein